ncbi:flagellar hook-basal body complex protein FliE [Novosphingobium humi]|uniref:Flagellar hook-basal body complex protein FliE n=1 Tax=Novosphingobium humi TaxID=2282397 RepID=A0ABY7TXR2_9SPHN|nr:flagellar hook-basal body complex protein FliE [Novosphingobium humi]WCT76904.1 flagellar hook-basal body complex protein FliE [Novosphingobium humi]
MSAIGGIAGGGAWGGASGLRDIMNLRAQIIEKSQILQQIHSPQTQSVGATGSGQGHFTDRLSDAMQSVNATQQRADQLTTAYETGQTQDVAKVMLAQQEASVGFEATLQVRNKLLSAYQDIMKMGV